MSKNKIIISGVILLILILSGIFIGKPLSEARTVSKQLNLGNKYLLEGKYEEAILAFEKVIVIEPKNVDARIGLGKAYIAVGREEDAEKVLKEAIEIDPQKIEPYIELGNLYIKQERIEEAIEILIQGYEMTKNEEIKEILNKLKLQQPKASLESGTYVGVQKVELIPAKRDEKIYYTLDGTQPSKKSVEYKEPFQIGVGQTVLRAISINMSNIVSEEIKYAYDVKEVVSGITVEQQTQTNIGEKTDMPKETETSITSTQQSNNPTQESKAIESTTDTSSISTKGTEANNNFSGLTIKTGETYEITNSGDNFYYLKLNNPSSNHKFDYSAYRANGTVFGSGMSRSTFNYAIPAKGKINVTVVQAASGIELIMDEKNIIASKIEKPALNKVTIKTGETYEITNSGDKFYYLMLNTSSKNDRFNYVVYYDNGKEVSSMMSTYTLNYAVPAKGKIKITVEQTESGVQVGGNGMYITITRL